MKEIVTKTLKGDCSANRKSNVTSPLKVEFDLRESTNKISLTNRRNLLRSAISPIIPNRSIKLRKNTINSDNSIEEFGSECKAYPMDPMMMSLEILSLNSGRNNQSEKSHRPSASAINFSKSNQKSDATRKYLNF